jgi:outer membrane biosynthesis protein TonB
VESDKNDIVGDSAVNILPSLVGEKTISEKEEKPPEKSIIKKNSTKESNKPKTPAVEKKRKDKEEKKPSIKPKKEKSNVKEKKSPSPSLVKEKTQLINFSGMSLERVVKECHRISKKVGIPDQQLNQSVDECSARNFQRNTTRNVTRSRNVQTTLRRQCKAKIPPEQRVLFSPEEMKLLIDECVADLYKNRE